MFKQRRATEVAASEMIKGSWPDWITAAVLWWLRPSESWLMIILTIAERPRIWLVRRDSSMASAAASHRSELQTADAGGQSLVRRWMSAAELGRPRA